MNELNPANLPDLPEPGYVLGTGWGLAVFGLCILGALLYLLWKLPRSGKGAGPGRPGA